MLLGLLEPTSGEIRVLGIDVRRHRYAALPRMNFSSPYVDLPHRLTVRQNLRVFGRLYGVADVEGKLAQPGEPGTEGDFLLELRIMADVGLVGYPSAGKSSLIAAMFGVGGGWGFYGIDGLGIAVCVIGVLIAAFFLMLDFEAIAQGVRMGLPERESWRPMAR